MASEHGVDHAKIGVFYLLEYGVGVVDILHRNSGEKLALREWDSVETSHEHEAVNLRSLRDLIA